MPDYETFDKKSKSNKKEKFTEAEEQYSNGHDFSSMLTDLIRGIPWKVAILLYLAMVFIFSDTFVDLLQSISGAVDGDTATTKGTMIQITTAVLAFVMLDLLDKGGII
jgi:hypothetical protein